MRFGWSTEVSLWRDSFSLSFSYSGKGGAGNRQKHRRESGLGSGGGPSKANDSCLRAGGPRSAPRLGEEANDGKGRLTFFMVLWTGASIPRGSTSVASTN